MANAFARAMLDQLQEPEREVCFTMRRTGWLRWMRFPFRCRDFLEVRAEEKELLRTLVEGRERPRVLDVGCGIGRHLSFLRREKPAAELTGLEINDQLRDYCRRTLPEARFFATLEDLPEQECFDLVLLMGNGLGIFGSRAATQEALRRLFRRLADGGALLAEAGNRSSAGFSEVRLVIEYQGETDGPFSWGYASSRWLQRELEAIGYALDSLTPSTIGPEFFFCVARRPGGRS